MKLFSVLLIPALALAAQAHAKGPEALSPTAKPAPGPADAEAFRQIREGYAARIEPIFKGSCFNCHSRFVSYPWNYKLPFVKKKIDEDLLDARERLELSEGFPLESRKDGAKALKSVIKVIRRKSMPPFEYMLFHWGSALSDEESAAISAWAEAGLKLLEQGQAAAAPELLSPTAKLGQRP
jgi:hypothetical protein